MIRMIDTKNRFAFDSSVVRQRFQSKLYSNQLIQIKDIIIRWLAQLKCVYVVVAVIVTVVVIVFVAVLWSAL